MSEPKRRVVALNTEHVSACQRLHKYAKYNGEFVFGAQVQKDLVELLRSAAATRDGAHGWVAVSSDPDGESEVVGALTAQWEDPAACVLLTLVVRSDARGQGVGKALLQALQQHVRAKKDELGSGGGGAAGDVVSGGGAGIKLLTDVSVANDAALGFFKRAGFKQAGRGNGRSVELSITCCSSRGSSSRGSCSSSPSGSSRAYSLHARCWARPASLGAGRGREPLVQGGSWGRAQCSLHARLGSATGMGTQGAGCARLRPSLKVPGAAPARLPRAPVRPAFGCC